MSSFFLEKNTLPSAPGPAQGKDLIFLIVFATRQRGIFLKKIQTLFAECLIRGTRQRPPLPSAMPRHSTKFLFVFGLQIFCAALLKHQELLVRIWGFLCLFDIFSYFILFT